METELEHGTHRPLHADLRPERPTASARERIAPGRLRKARLIGPYITLLTLGTFFVLWDAAKLDLGPVESRLGVAAGESLGPLGQMFGGWEPSLWPAEVIPSQLWFWAEGTLSPTAGAVRWPAAIAGVGLGLILGLRLRQVLGAGAGVWMGLCWFGSVALMDRSGGAGLDLIAGLGTIAALDRILAKGSDWVAGCWAALAFLAAGWPPLAVIVLALVVIRRAGATVSLRLLAPPLVAAVLWSLWALGLQTWPVPQARAEAWAAALALPLTHQPAWLLAPGVLLLALPWSPLAVLAASGRVRATWPSEGRDYVVGWLRAGLASALAGTLVPGMADAARIVVLAGLCVTAAAVAHSTWALRLTERARKVAIALAMTISVGWALLATLQGGYLAAAVSYYRPIALVLAGVGLAIGLHACWAAYQGQVRGLLWVLVAVAICLRVAHWGVYTPEWNYRFSQGPWGRAIGQWVPPKWPLYTIDTWPADLAFATEHPIRQLAHPRMLVEHVQRQPAFVLLHPDDFAHWPKDAPKLQLVRQFEDERGDLRILARTPGRLYDEKLAVDRE